jgi:hypothetical protein
MMHMAVRYALGRRTYAPSECLEFLVAYGASVPQATRDMLRAEVAEVLARCEVRGTTLGDRCGHETWRAFLARLEALP